MNEAPADLTASYRVERHDGALTIAPIASAGPGRTARLSFAVGSIFGLVCLVGYVLASLYLRDKMARNPVGQPIWLPWVCPSGVLLPLGLLAVAGCVKLLRTFRRPLVVEPNGPVTYGRQLLVAAGHVAGVTVERESCWVSPESGPDYERKTAYVYIGTKDGRFVELPTTYFSNLDGWELGETLGAALAATLGVPLSFEPPPPEHSTPQTRARRWWRVFGTFALVIGIPHWLAGFGLTAAWAAARFDPAIRIPDDFPPPWFSAIFICSGAVSLYFACRCFGYSRGNWLRLLAALAVLESAALVAVRFWK